MKRVLISGAGIAGPALAYWLTRGGFDVTVVERAPALRTGGQAVDFRGPIHREVLERMGIWDPIHARRTTPGDLVLLGREGSPGATLPAMLTAGDVEILRGDLSALLYERSLDADYRFGDHIVATADRGSEVTVTFASGRVDTFDLVVGADGLHSGVRALAFGEKPGVLRHHGYRIATFGLSGALGFGRESVVYSLPGRGICVGATGRGGEARCLLVYEGEAFGAERRDLDEQRRAIRATFAGMGWETARVLAALDAASDLYVDAIATVHLPRYAAGRVVLLGDAAHGGTLGGQGSSLAIVGAYVLAGELGRGGDLASALARYEERIRPYATTCQKGAMRAGEFFAPRTRAGLALRNFAYGVLAAPVLRGFFEWLVKDAATSFALPAYADLPSG